MSTFSFNGGLSATGTIQPLFSRSVPTVDPDGLAVGADVARFGRPAAIAGVDEATVFDPALAWRTAWALDSGLDHDGQTELMVVNQLDNARVIVYDDPSNPASKRVTQLALPLCSAASGSLGFLNAFMMGTDPNSGRPRGYSPVTACVCHGFIALWCSAILQTAAGDWDIAGSGVVYSTDRGQTWDVLFDDLDAPVQMFMHRGALWSLQKYFTPYSEPGSGGPLLEAWMAASDYRLPVPDTSGPGNANGGRFFAWRMARSAPDQPWQVGDEFGVAARFDMTDLCAPGEQISRHAHAAGIVRWGQNGVRLVGSLGDSRRCARFMTATLSDRSGPYTRPGDWTARDNYHGHAARPAPPYHPDYGAGSPQPVGVLQGRWWSDGLPPDGRTLVWGADNGSELLFQMRCPDAGPPSIVQVAGTSQTQSSERGGGPLNSCWQIRTLAPERETPIVAIATESSDIGGNAAARRLLFAASSAPGQPDPLDGAFAEMGVGRFCPGCEPVGWLTAVPFGPNIVTGGDFYGLHVRPQPAVRRARPVLVSPGGRNLMCGQFLWDQPHQGVVSLRRARGNSGPWVDGRPGGPQVPLNPQPPSMCERVLRITVDNNVPSSLITRLRIGTDNPANPDGNAPGWRVQQRQIRRFRFWAMDASAGPVSGFPYASETFYSIRLASGGKGSSWGSSASVVSGSRWMPHIVSYTDAETIDHAPVFELAVARDGALNDSTFYLAMDQAREDAGSFGYPQRPGAPFASAPNEMLRLTNLGVSGDFTVLLAGLVPTDDWDARTPREGGVWPLLSLRGAHAFNVEVGAVSLVHGMGGLQLQATALGVQRTVRWPVARNAYWGHGTPLLLALSLSGNQLTGSASIGGESVSDSAPLTLAGFDRSALELRFCGGSGEVASFQWVGGQVLPVALEPGAIRDRFSTLDFLSL